MENKFYSINDLALLYFQDIEYLIKILNANGIKLSDYVKCDDILETQSKCYKKCQELGYFENEEECK